MSVAKLGLIALDGQTRHELAQLLDQVREAFLLAPQLRDSRVVVVDARIQARDHGLPRVARFRERGHLRGLRRFELLELGLHALGVRIQRRKPRKVRHDGRDARRARAIQVVVVDDHATERGRTLLRQQQLEHLGATRDVARRAPANRAPRARPRASDRAVRLLAERAAGRALIVELRAHVGQFACRVRVLELGRAQRLGAAFVAARGLAREPRLELLDLFAHRIQRGFALALVLRARERPRDRSARENEHGALP